MENKTPFLPQVFKSNSTEKSLALISKSFDKDDNFKFVPLLNSPKLISPSFKLKGPLIFSDRNSINSSSCDNFQSLTDHDSNFLSSSRISKASSDNPISEICPPIPPRDYQKSKKIKSSEIHPIISEGKKLSNTHYWLLPDKISIQDISKSLPDQNQKVDYMNIDKIKKSEKSLSKSDGFQKARNKPRDFFLCDGHTGEGGEEDEGLLIGEDNQPDYGLLAYDNPVSFDSQSIKSLPSNFDEASSNDNFLSMGEVERIMEELKRLVPGVTNEEGFTALSISHYDVEKAAKYLKVENLFRLAVASRKECLKTLEFCHWDQQMAASYLLDNLSK